MLTLFLIFTTCKESSKVDSNIKNNEKKEIASSPYQSDSIRILIDYLKNFSPSLLTVAQDQIYDLIKSNKGDRITDSAIKTRMDRIMDTDRYVYFYYDDFKDLFYNLNCNDSEKGIRIYIYKYKSDLKQSDKVTDHPYRNQFNVVLQGACRFVESSIDGTIYDYGDVCPPNCPIKGDDNPVWIPKISRNQDAAKDGVIKKK